MSKQEDAAVTVDKLIAFFQNHGWCRGASHKRTRYGENYCTIGAAWEAKDIKLGEISELQDYLPKSNIASFNDSFKRKRDYLVGLKRLKAQILAS